MDRFMRWLIDSRLNPIFEPDSQKEGNPAREGFLRPVPFLADREDTEDSSE